MSVSVIFDMDGVLLDSEPIWWRAGVEALGSVGIAIDDTWSTETRGMRTDDALRYWFRKFPWHGKTIDELNEEIDARVIEIIASHSTPLPGVLNLVEFLLERQIQMAVCSSAPGGVIEAVLQSLGIRSAMRQIVSASDEMMGKPHPAAYLRCANLMQKDPRHCIAIEDSVYGAIAAKAAQMKVVAVQNGQDCPSGAFDFCDARLATLADFNEALFRSLSES